MKLNRADKSKNLEDNTPLILPKISLRVVPPPKLTTVFELTNDREKFFKRYKEANQIRNREPDTPISIFIKKKQEMNIAPRALGVLPKVGVNR